MTKEFAEKVCSMFTIGRGGFEGWLIELKAFELSRVSTVTDGWGIRISAQLPHRETGQLVPIHTWVMSDMLDRLSLTRAVD